MIEELNIASRLLNSALDRYLAACSSIRNNYFGSSLSVSVPPEVLSHITAQVQFVATLELKVREAKDTITRTHNCSPSLVPIHVLPSELMEHIFLFVSRMRWSMQYGTFFRHWGSHPEVISHVCSRWRKISLGLPSLWRYINIPFITEDVDATHINRGVVFASRARPLLLDVLFYSENEFDGSSILSKPEHLNPFISAIAPYTRSLKFVFSSENELKDHHTILSQCFKHCIPGTLKSLSISYHDEYHDTPPIFIDVATELPGYLQDICWDVKTADFDLVLESLTVLQLTGIYPFWTSKAYHGLVELRLYSGHDLVSEEHLQGILRASPALRILQLSIGIAEPLAKNTYITPVPLEHLEVLVVIEIDPNLLGTFLRWLAPGSKPLKFAIANDTIINCNELQYQLTDDEVRSFFSRSNVTEVYANNIGYPNVLDLIDLCPHLRTLEWDQFMFENPNPSVQSRFPISHPRLESLMIRRGSAHKAPFLNLIGESSTIQSISFVWAFVETGFIEELRDTAGIPNVREFSYPERPEDPWENLVSWPYFTLF
ncbi:hypothetical protein FRC11_004191 [Ceratobasidium sp. 423]|nr:hypothetical protein FRC11_004191 [Ceratobasidium sp. 423]